MIPLSAKGFAEFVLAGPSKKAQIVRNILKPKSKEARMIVLYYSRAIRVIRSDAASGEISTRKRSIRFLLTI